MSAIFADTFYFLALLNARDAAHQKAVQFSRKNEAPLVTTAWVLTEAADALADASTRNWFLNLLRTMKSAPDVRIVPPSHALFEAGVGVYARRRDKDWALTDCISFVVMANEGITEAATADHHFEQAGFTALLV